MDKKQPWAHIDIAGVMESHEELPYLSKGMSGEDCLSVCPSVCQSPCLSVCLPACLSCETVCKFVGVSTLGPHLMTVCHACNMCD